MPDHDFSNSERPKFRFLLFIADGEPNSVAAKENLRSFCAEELGVDHEVEVVNVLDDAQPALDHGIVLTPALLVVEPPPRVIVAGSLSDRDKIRFALRLPTPARAL